jgi:hypothetical protein
MLDTQWIHFSLELDKFKKAAKIFNQGQKNRPQKCIKNSLHFAQKSTLHNPKTSPFCSKSTLYTQKNALSVHIFGENGRVSRSYSGDLAGKCAVDFIIRLRPSP